MNTVFLKTIFLLFFFSSATFAAFEPLVCQGQVTLTKNFAVDVVLSLSSLNEGDLIDLFSPITSDEDADVQLTQQKIFKTKHGLRVIATYDDSNGSAFMTFELKQRDDGSAVLSDFKGFEGSQSFGPAELNCKNDMN